MESRPSYSLLSFVFILTSYLLILCRSISIVKRLPGYAGDLPFQLETGYVGVGEKEGVQLFYYFVESTRNAESDPLIFYIPGGPGASALFTLLYEIGPLNFDFDNGPNNITLILNPNAWTQIANIIFVDIPAGTGFSYSETKDGWISSDNILATHAKEFIKKFLVEHPRFLNNPLYIAGISYMGLLVPKITLEIFEGNERGDQPTLNIQGYILVSPLTDKFKDINSRLEYAHRMALISDDTYKTAIKYCHGNYMDIDASNSLCANSLRQYEESDFNAVAATWANSKVVQQAINIRQGTIGKWELRNSTMHYDQGKNDTFCYSYDIFSSFHYHKKLSSKHCRSLIMSGDHDMTFPYVGIEQWIASLDLGVENPWKPFFSDGQVGGYETKYAHNNYSLTFSTVKGAGHLVPYYKPKESMVLIAKWFSSQVYSSDS
ncbi:unnamed protein product [Lactuca saligna]|uniref:Peptidase S10, serine carboxypeptidase, Alpha/Beta hydrolase fold protein n=1 Tax=Lactuca saligna TaxID=75948 RepID=A0AA35ZXI8_LACSI|nr:unnamed protein product [Lactuca saligna]